MGIPRHPLVTALIVCSSGWIASPAAAQLFGVQDAAARAGGPVTLIAAATTGMISGTVLDEAGRPLPGVVVSATGGSTSFAVSDSTGQFTMPSLSPGPYLVRAHLDGYLPARRAMVNVRPSTRTVSTFTLRRAGQADEPTISTAGGDGDLGARTTSARDDGEISWRLRHLKRSVLKDAATNAEIPAETESWFLTDSLLFLGRAVESAGALFMHAPLQGEVNLLTTGAFDAPLELLKMERTRGVTYLSVGAPVGSHGDWTVKAALNQGDLSSWILTGNYLTRSPARHRYQLGMSYGAHRYEGGNAAAMAMPEGARNVGAIYAYDDWRVSRHFTIGYGAHYAHYDYLMSPAHLSPRLSATIEPTEHVRIRALAHRSVTAPGAEEFLPPTRAHVLPPQRTFAPLSRAGFQHETLQHYELALERVLDGATIGVRAFKQRVDNQMVTVFGLRSADAWSADIGHYAVGNAGDVDVRGWGLTLEHALGEHVRGSVAYSIADADWASEKTSDRWRLIRSVPSAIRGENERVHDLSTSLETEVPSSGTRLFVLYKLSNAYVRPDVSDTLPGVDGRWDVQVSQGLPFMNFLSAEWEMLVAVRNLFRESAGETSVFDELLVARPPKRLVGGITVKF
jgi:outer membrane receptor protein involved in Fe transport